MPKREHKKSEGLTRAGDTPFIKALIPGSKAKRQKAAIISTPKETPDPETLPKPDAAAFSNRQLNLFQSLLCNTDEERDQLSNAIDLWDSVPRYTISRQAMTKHRIKGRFLEKHQAEFQHKGRTYTRIISPARSKDLDGIDRDFYPSGNEELVEDALRKLAIEQQAGYFDQPNYRSGVVFSLYALRQELKKRGHSRSYYQIVQSLDILSHCVVDIVPHGEGEGRITSACLSALAVVSRKKLATDPKAKWAAQFHPLVTASMDKVTYRQYNYHLMMSHSTQLARWLHKLLVIKYTFADHFKPFETRYSTIKRDSGGLLDNYSRVADAIDALEEALAELKQRDVIFSCERSNTTGVRGKILDASFKLLPSMTFIRDTKAASKRLSNGVLQNANQTR